MTGVAVVKRRQVGVLMVAGGVARPGLDQRVAGARVLVRGGQFFETWLMMILLFFDKNAGG